jgi:hypothetical protein
MMKRRRSLSILAVLYGGLLASAWGRPGLPPPPPLPPPAPAIAAPGAGDVPREGYAEGRRGNWRNLSPEQRDAIRRLSQEERQALINRAQNRAGEAPAPPGRLSREERRQLRAQIREEHERRGLRPGGGKRP